MTWFACDVELPHDRKVVELTDKFGAKGGWAWVCLMAAAKAHGRAGVVDIPLRRFAADACLDSTEEAAAILRELEQLEVIALPTITPALATVELSKWQKYQQDALNQRRVYRHRKGDKPDPEPHDHDTTITESAPTGTGTGTGTNVGSSSSRSVSLNDSVVQTVVARFEKAATSRLGLEVDGTAISRALHDFIDIIGLQGHAFDCAEWCGVEKSRKKRNAALSLRTWLRGVRKDMARELEPREQAGADQAQRNTSATADRTRFQPLLEEMFAWSEGKVIQGAKKLEAMGETPTARKVELLIGPSPLAEDVA